MHHRQPFADETTALPQRRVGYSSRWPGTPSSVRMRTQLERQYENLAVTDLARFSTLYDGLDRRLDKTVVHGDENLHLTEQVAHLLHTA